MPSAPDTGRDQWLNAVLNFNHPSCYAGPLCIHNTVSSYLGSWQDIQYVIRASGTREPVLARPASLRPAVHVIIFGLNQEGEYAAVNVVAFKNQSYLYLFSCEAPVELHACAGTILRTYGTQFWKITLHSILKF